jgi:hypothetical protein
MTTASPPVSDRAGATANCLRLGVCCPFPLEPIKFHTTAATAMLRL